MCRSGACGDQALQPASCASLPDDRDALAIRQLAGATHWLVHQKTAEATGRIGDF